MNRSKPALITQAGSYVAPSNLLISGAIVAICHVPSSAAVGVTDVVAYAKPNVLGPTMGAHMSGSADQQVMIAM